MVLKRGKWAVGFLVLPTLGMWVGVGYLFKYAFLDHPYVQFTYLLGLLGLLVATLVITYYANELGRVEVGKGMISSYSILGRQIFSLPIKQVEGYAVTENDTDLGAVYNLVLATKDGIRFLSLWGIGGERWRIQKHLGKQRYRKELMNKSFRRDILFVGGMFVLLGILGVSSSLLSEAAAGKLPGATASFNVTVADYQVRYSDEAGWMETSLMDVYDNNFLYEINEPYFTEAEMDAFLNKLDAGTKFVTIWTYDRAYRDKLYGEDTDLDFYQKHYAYGSIPVLEATAGATTYGNRNRSRDRDHADDKIMYTICGIGIVIGGALMWWGTGPRPKNPRFSVKPTKRS